MKHTVVRKKRLILKCRIKNAKFLPLRDQKVKTESMSEIPKVKDLSIP